MNIVHLEHPDGVIATLGGQTAINLAEPLARRGVRIIGTDCEGIEKAENRDAFDADHQISWASRSPQGEAVTDIESGVRAAERIGYPVLVRPELRAGRTCHGDCRQRGNAPALPPERSRGGRGQTGSDRPVHRGQGGRGGRRLRRASDVFLPGIMELVERTGVHSGDSTSVYPSFSISAVGQGHHRWTTPRGLVWASASWDCSTSSSSWTAQTAYLSSRSIPRASRTRAVPVQVHRRQSGATSQRAPCWENRLRSRASRT